MSRHFKCLLGKASQTYSVSYLARKWRVEIEVGGIVSSVRATIASNTPLELSMIRVYLASPLGFSPELKDYRERIKRRLNNIGCEVFDPWDQPLGSIMRKARAISEWDRRVAAFGEMAKEIGRMNEQAIRDCDILLGVLDGAELDSGTVCEIGFAAGLGKRCYGLRTDFRNLGDLEGLPFNLQVLYFIESTGGRLFRAIEEVQF